MCSWFWDIDSNAKMKNRRQLPCADKTMINFRYISLGGPSTGLIIAVPQGCPDLHFERASTYIELCTSIAWQTSSMRVRIGLVVFSQFK